MALSIDDIYQIEQMLVNKYKQGYLSPSDFNYGFNLAQNQYFNYLLGLPENYSPGSPLDIRGKQFSRTEREKLSPFFVRLNTVIPGNGQITKVMAMQGVASFIDLCLCTTNGTGQVLTVSDPIPEIPANKFASYLNDSIDPVTVSAPVAVDEGGYYQLYPVSGYVSGQQVSLSYYKYPVDAVWAYTVDSNGLPVYNPSASVNPLWNNNEYSEIISRHLAMIGINLSNAQVIQYSGLQKQQG